MKPQFITQLEAEIKANPVKKYSQTGEEGVILSICKLLGIETGTFIDLGAGTGKELSNVALLHERGWDGVGFEGGHPENPAPFVRTGVWITKDNVRKLIAEYTPHDFQFLSIDLDGNDYWILDAVLQFYSPKIFCAEINSSIRQDIPLTIAYNEIHQFKEDNYYGMNGLAFCQLVEKYGYAVVWNQNNLNAFAVKSNSTDCITIEVENYKPYRPDFIRKNDWPESQRKDKNWVQL